MAEKNALVKIIPKEQLEATEKEITAVVKATDTNELHIAYNKINSFVSLFSLVTKNEIISRIKKTLKKNGNKVETEIGEISLVERANFEYDEDKLLKFLKKKKLGLDSLFKIDWEVVTKNSKELEAMEERGLVQKKLKMDSTKAENLVVKYPELVELIHNNPTYYLKNL